MISAGDNSNFTDYKPDLTPLLDIIFIVMVFLLLTANISIKSLAVDVPVTDETAVLNQTDTKVIAISILAQADEWGIDDNKISDWDSFKQQLLIRHKDAPEHTILITADKSAPIDKMMKILAFLKNNDVTKINVMMEEDS
ncbi:ExbD/TolR family protein [Moritella dasanensis]|jgi:biopolymer transport protein ExbD|uniref:ExbD/TolR family protein n=1 Tax=Moritella dasanensis TaxID=428031 RepID=UPI0002E7F7EA|nr:biopolymer transporter ExbD [Moritella dasanensis]